MTLDPRTLREAARICKVCGEEYGILIALGVSIEKLRALAAEIEQGQRAEAVRRKDNAQALGQENTEQSGLPDGDAAERRVGIQSHVESAEVTQSSARQNAAAQVRVNSGELNGLTGEQYNAALYKAVTEAKGKK